ncbi:Sro9p SKDI_03G0340 [Saccharomyces kudriavzevii IFO 1802]|uniref:SRO9-like protein n=2 Tax=Saccharomyces kudriavzevii (strain ATCC MYA-4449 / AS 2.2408 / CBS 8840 / NBRC 1802 / NCYC 2889) TaxID=226230 RepID=J5RVE6_SACK1|nr:uncharacterized protein SKDI_03G0340 [Saccharomyces kudriavzevii IFO 1802]EJT42891.1 SRO9-like protein [Saccharomyces kudriavzevii IFO 1802]CAI4056437.1 hypothetical protein SKDI_03G0340 [Saccharomyces kudriavzevii IFO 1802]
MSAETVTAANTATAPIPETQEQESSKSKQVNLTPAPLPTSSPWKLAQTEVPVSSISIEDLDATRKKKNRTPTPKSSTATKWVPIKASITVSGTKRSGSKNGGNSGNNNNKSKNNKNAASSTSSSSANRKKKHHQHNAKKQQQQQVKKDGSESAGEEESKDTAPQENDQSTQQQQPPHHRNHHHSQHHNSTGPQRRKFHNSNNTGMPQNQGLPPQFKPYQGRNPRPNISNRLKYQNHLHHNPQQPMVKLQQQFYPVQPVLMAINNIARQIEYYFSEENLTIDNYLRSKLSKDGFAPLSLISKFYRVVNMSFGGDANLVLAALREIVANETATVNVVEGSLVTNEAEAVSETNEVKETSPLDRYFIRSKSWSNWLPETFETEVNIEKELAGDALDQFMISVPPVPQQEEEISAESTPQQQEARDESAPVATSEPELTL